MRTKILAFIVVAALVFGIAGLFAGCSAGIGVGHEHVHSANCGHVYSDGAWVAIGHVHSDTCGCHYVDGRWCR
jgi:hypothetical protein